MHPEFFRLVAVLLRHHRRVVRLTGAAHSHLAGQLGHYFTPKEVTLGLGVIVVVLFALLVLWAVSQVYRTFRPRRARRGEY